MNTVLVTGVNGFVGHHVALLLHQKGLTVVGAGNQPSLEADLEGVVSTYISCDLTDPVAVTNIPLGGIDAIINLAGFAKVGDSIGQGELYNKVNVGVHAVLYQECLNQAASPRIIAVSTGAVYDPNQPLPITESSECIDDESTNEYVRSKKHMEQAVFDFKEKGLDCIVVRPFNHSGPGQLPGFLIPDLGEQIQQAVHDSKPLLVGNLETKRDYTDVRDVAAAYVGLATCDRTKLNHTTYNVCSGVSRKGTEILRLLAESFDAPSIETKIDENRIRPNEIMDIYGSYSRLHQDIEWDPQTPIDQMIKDYAAWKRTQK